MNIKDILKGLGFENDVVTLSNGKFVTVKNKVDDWDYIEVVIDILNHWYEPKGKNDAIEWLFQKADEEGSEKAREWLRENGYDKTDIVEW